MKKKIYLFTTILSAAATLFLSSCLKDKTHELDFGGSGTFVNFPKGGLTNFSGQAITGSDTSTRVFAINIASPELQGTSTSVTLKVGDQASVDAYNASQTVVHYELMPTNAYKVYTTAVTIPAKQLFAYDSVTVYKNLLDPAKSYMLPITIATTSNGKLTANLNTLLYHVIGNDFAGTYKQNFQRYNAADSTSAPLNGQSFVAQPTTFFPVSPTQFEVYSGYAGFIYRYEVTFTKTGLGADAKYSNFAVTLNSSDVAAQSASITITQQPKFLAPNYDPTGSYTYAQALTLFHFQYVATTSAPRYLTDTFYK